VTSTNLPPLPVLGPTGEPVTLRSLRRDDTVAVLAARLGVEALRIDGQNLPPALRLVEIDRLRSGASLSASRAEDEAVEHRVAEPVVDVRVASGPCVAPWRALPPGRYLVGRAPTVSIRLDDPAAEAHHAIIDVNDHGDVEITQLAGTTPLRSTDRSSSEEIELRVATSVIGIRRRHPRPTGDRAAHGGGSVAVHPTDPWRRIVWRAPFSHPHWNDPELIAPTAPVAVAGPSATGLVGVGAAAVGAVAIALVLGNAMFLLFAAMGVVAATATFLVGCVVARRSRRRARLEHDERLAAFRDSIEACRTQRLEHHRAVHRTVDDAICDVLGHDDGSGNLWRQRIDAPEMPLVAVIGRGNVRWTPHIDLGDRRDVDPELLRLCERCACLDQSAAPVTIAPGDAIALHGPSSFCASVARSLLVQMAVSIGPADWRLVVVSSDRRRWEWTRWLPHGAFDSGALVIVEPLDDRLDALADALASIDDVRRVLVVTDEPRLFTARTGPLRRFLATTATAASLVLVDTDSTVPSSCRRVLTVGSTGTASWAGDVPETDDAAGIEFHGISLDLADRVARRLACLIDPEDDGGVTGNIASTVGFVELFEPAECTPAAIGERWRIAGADPAPVAPIGMSADGRVDIDLVRDGPHGLIAGTTGSGKSELLRTLVVSLAVAVSPEHLNFVLVDYKGGSTFDACADLPHTVGLVTDLDGGLAERALASLDAELHRRERLLRDFDAVDLADYRTGVLRTPIARLVVVIDEFAALAKDLPHFLAALVDVAQRGRSLGVHLLLATQRPAGVVNDDIRANTNLRIALRLQDTSDALDVVADARPASFPRGTPGRTALRLGPDEIVVFQSARCSGPWAEVGVTGIVVEPMYASPAHDDVENSSEASPGSSELRVMVDAVIEAAATSGLATPHRPWTEPLPFPLPTGRLDELPCGDGAASIGWIDDPAHQCRRPLSWEPASGSLALVGSLGSGTTSTLIALAASICRAAAPAELHLYVIDSRGDDGLAGLATIAHCGGVVRITEDERVHRVLQRVVASIDRRMGTGGETGSHADPQIVVMIDGLGSLRASLAPIERQATFDLFQRVVTDGPSVGVALVVVDDMPAALSHVTTTDRWVFRVNDPTVASGFGVRAPQIPDDLPGRLRIASSGLEAQVAMGAAGLAALPSRGSRETSLRDGDRPSSDDGGPQLIGVLAEYVPAMSLGAVPGSPAVGSLRLEVGVAADDLAVACLEVVTGDHVLVVGGPRSGVSTALRRCVDAMCSAMTRLGSPVRVIEVDRLHPVPDDVLDTAVASLVVIDDAHRVDDPGLLGEIIRGDHPHVTLMAGARADAVRTSYGHWTRELAKHRCGIVLTSRGDPDGDLLGVQLLRRSLVPVRPGLAWIVDGGSPRLVQVAVD
jgi:S-DNA-T family DNA segregation ATPase FtsK/SpoIIIE